MSANSPLLRNPHTKNKLTVASEVGFCAVALLAGPAWAQTSATPPARPSGITAQGNTGGLVIPSAYTLDEGSIAATYGNYREPKIANNQRSVNTSLGIGIWPSLELFGRLTDYTTPGIGGEIDIGQRDLSANIKWQMPMLWPQLPKIALGINDVAGGAVNFGSAYIAISDDWGPLRWTLGHARAKTSTTATAPGFAFNGTFGGVDVALGNTGLSALAEYDGQQKHLGLRYMSAPISALGGAYVAGSLHRSMGSIDAVGRDVDTNHFSLSLVVPLGAGTKPTSVVVEGADVLPPMEATLAAPSANAENRLEALQRDLVAVGLERVRVGTASSGARGAGTLVVEYENHRYGHNEADALGIVLGLAAERAPPGTVRLRIVTLKAGLPVYETKTDVSAFRQFLRDGNGQAVRDTLQVSYGKDEAAGVRWLHDAPSYRSLARLELKPDIVYAVGTEVGLFDYSLALNAQGIVPLWRGAEIYTSVISPSTTSQNYENGFAFASLRQRDGLKVAALQQSFWLGKHVLANVGVGRFNFDEVGVQAQASFFVPGRADVVRLRGASYQSQSGPNAGANHQMSGSYRWVASPTTWIEAGLQQYSDGSRGPSLVFTRWFGDVGVHVFYRRGGDVQFAGLEFSLPLTPRRGMVPGAVQVTGTSQFRSGLRTRITDSNQAANLVQPGAVRDLALDYNAEVQQLNAGRTGQAYFESQLGRMREAFYLYGRQLLGR